MPVEVTKAALALGITVYSRRVETVPELFDELRKFSPLGRGYLFRGQRNDWTPRCTLDRLCEGSNTNHWEDRILNEFRRRAHLYLAPGTEPRTFLEWLALLQHHGGATRLLDVSTSPYVAAFHAFAREGTGDVVIWAFPWTDLAQRARHAIRSDFASGLPTALGWEQVIAWYAEKRILRRVAIPLQPFRVNPRMAVQQGAFLYLGDADADGIANILAGAGELSSLSPLKITKLLCPAAARGYALAVLRQMGMNRETLFPGLDGLAQSVWQTFLPETGDYNLPDRQLFHENQANGWPDAADARDVAPESLIGDDSPKTRLAVNDAAPGAAPSPIGEG